MRLVTTWFGSFLFDDGEIAKKELFPPDPQSIATRLIQIEDWKVLKEEKKLIKGLDEFYVHEKRLERIGGGPALEEPPFIDPEPFGFTQKILHEAMMELSRRKMRKAPTVDDHISQAVNAMDSLTRSSNILLERLREWYGLHFPELDKLVTDERYVSLIAEFGSREKIPDYDGESIGGELGSEEKKVVMSLASTLKENLAERKRLESYLESRMKEIAPNLTELAGPIIGARLISLAGGLESLARMPSSTVQTLGAEKALFRHIQTGTRPPKHGVLFQHPLVHQAPYWQRGAIARALSSKVVVAARADWSTKRFIAPELKKDLERTVATIRRKHPSRPKRRKR